MNIVAAVFFMLFLLYKVYAIPVGAVFAFFLTRSLVRSRSPGAATGIALAWTVAVFTPLVTPAQSFFDALYSPWYVAWTMSPPTPEFSFGALMVTVAVSLGSSWLAVLGARPKLAQLPDSDDDLSAALDDDERNAIDALTEADRAAIDAALLSQLNDQWQKTALIVAHAMYAHPDKYDAIPYVFYGQRVLALAEEGVIEAKGNVRRLRFSEVRKKNSAASEPDHA